MLGKHTNRRTFLKASGSALLGGLAGCTAGVPDTTPSEWAAGQSRSGLDLLQYLPSRVVGSDGRFSLRSPTAIRQAQTDIGAKQSARLLGGTVGKDGWISDHEIETQITWSALQGWGYVFTTPLDKAEILKRYRESFLREMPAGSHREYTLIRRSSSWHAVRDNEVIKIPTYTRAEVGAFLDDIEREYTHSSNVDLLLRELDTRYSITITNFASNPGEFERSGIEHHGIGRAISPNPGEPGYTFSVGILTNAPAALAEWAREQQNIFVRRQKFSDPRVRTVGSLVVLQESGTYDAFDGEL